MNPTTRRLVLVAFLAALLSPLAYIDLAPQTTLEKPVLTFGSVEAQALPDVTQQTIIAWAAVLGATSYEIHAQKGDGTPIGTWVDAGSALQQQVSAWLSGQPLNADYQLLVRGKNADETGPASDPLNVTLIGSLVKPVPTIQ